MTFVTPTCWESSWPSGSRISCIDPSATALCRHLDHEHGEHVATSTPWTRIGTSPCSTTWSRRCESRRSTVAASTPTSATGGRSPRLTRKPWKRLRRAVDALTDPPSDPELHEIRKRAKQARYAYEATTRRSPARRPVASPRSWGAPRHPRSTWTAVVTTDWLYRTTVELDDREDGLRHGTARADLRRRAPARWAQSGDGSGSASGRHTAAFDVWRRSTRSLDSA